MALSLPLPHAAPDERQAMLRLLGRTLFVAAFLLSWVSLHPFKSLASSTTIELSSGNDTLTYVVFALLAFAGVLLAGPQLRLARPALVTTSFLGLCGWLVVTCVASDDPATSMRRLVLAAAVAALMASLFLLPANRSEMARLMAAAAITVLVLSYLGVLLVPDLSIHQITDVGEPDLAGDWRGVFDHKNNAAGVLSLLVFQGIFVARSGLLLTGVGIVAASLVFMVFAGGKSALVLVGLAMLAVAVFRWAGRGVLGAALVMAPIVLINTFGLGSVLSDNIAAVTGALPIDPTFTGRTDIWHFAIDALPGHLLFGHGFDAFWNTASTRFGGEDATWAGTAAHAHNSYLDAVVNLGLPGLALVLWAFVAQPLRDLVAATCRGADPALTDMLAQTWLFGLYLSGTETVFFRRDDPIWITFLFALLGLRIAACCRLRES